MVGGFQGMVSSSRRSSDRTPTVKSRLSSQYLGYVTLKIAGENLLAIPVTGVAVADLPAVAALEIHARGQTQEQEMGPSRKS